ncbi:gustatory receptor 8a-like [Teleopsis dalmanni]|uniref:gustatory receptor 8a-like n=1 Tax=Teleopsis dalmanni TaxID=139649 RepID=UPI0018CE0408|nr:gustatory receptor 8a-like [Teleopsis dalmanni]
MSVIVKSKILRMHMRIFQIFGFFTLSINPSTVEEKKKRKECLLLLWSVLLFTIYNSTYIFVNFISTDEYYFKKDRFGYFNDGLKINFAHLALVASYIESIFFRSKLRRFWLLYNKLREQTLKKNDKVQNCWTQIMFNWRYLCIFYIFLIMQISLEITFIVRQEKSRHLILYWSMFLPYIYALHTRNMEFVFHLEIMRKELVKLEHDLCVLADYTRFATIVVPFTGFGNYLRRKIYEKQQVYQTIYGMYRMFQESFSFSIAAVLLQIYVRVLVDTYFTYYTIYTVGNTYENFLLIPAILEIPVFLLTSKYCMAMVKRITYQLHNIIREAHDIKISMQIQNFSLQILHQHIRIDGIGIAVMDGYMLTRAVGSVTTYMIFFIQFMPKFQSLN